MAGPGAGPAAPAEPRARLRDRVIAALWLGERRAAATQDRRSRRRYAAPRSPLGRRIVAFNLVGLGLLVAGVLYLNQFREGLIELRINSLRTQGEIIAIAIAESAGSGPGGARFDRVRATEVLTRLARPIGVRAKIYDRGGRLTADTRTITSSSTPIVATPLPPPDSRPLGDALTWLDTRIDRLVESFREPTEIYSETARAGVASDAEIYDALRGNVVTAVRINSEGRLIVSVALPIQRFKAVLGALEISTEGDDIGEIVRAERLAILQVFAVAILISLMLSVVLANTIARPLRRLAEAADEGGAADGRLVSSERIEIPDLTARPDEIGLLSGAMLRMTRALYDRIAAIESFAADVAHEIKNPLTSLRSAVETMRFARTDENRERLLKVIEKDVGRLDRLVTDISNASRLDAELVRDETESLDLRLLLETVGDIESPKAEARGASLVLDLAEGDLRVTGLEGRLAQVFLNLVDNALSFSPDGGVVRLGARPTEGGGVLAMVEDEGPGIPEDNLGSVFERFYSERPDHEEFGNHSGLGLSISRQIIEAHGGRIWAENRPGPETGARFCVELPSPR